ncbi:MAG: hypothetical protein OEW67_15155 [Cyclobacteriaceae bacterium]|nr:hypothetical protein [Cyclobacteriaceae bacterium]
MQHNEDKIRARESRASIERIYITVRHLFMRGSYKPLGVSGEALMESLLTLNPEIYGLMKDPERVELDGLLYVMERLPDGIEECRIIKLVAREGYENTSLKVIVPPKRKRNCYRIDDDRMYIEMTRGRSDVNDILTHLTFLFSESQKIMKHSLTLKGKPNDDWQSLKSIVQLESNGEDFDEKRASIYLSNILGRTIDETTKAIEKFNYGNNAHSLYHITYWLGKIAIGEELDNVDREVTFSAELRKIVGQHIYGEQWAHKIKTHLVENGLHERPIHIISANLHSFMNAVYGFDALKEKKYANVMNMAMDTSEEGNSELRNKITDFASKNGMVEIEDHSGTNLTVQIFDLENFSSSHWSIKNTKEETPVLVVMDYAFGEQAFECMDELLKPYEVEGEEQQPLNIASINIMGKAGILEGKKGDIMIPTAHVFEGTADNYPFKNDFSKEEFVNKQGISVFEGPMITVLGTSLQNKDVLIHFLTSTWNAVGLEMEGACYQKAIQAATMIRKSIDENVKIRYAYYASDNPLETGSTLASGSLGAEGVVPTYMITERILEKIFDK